MKKILIITFILSLFVFSSSMPDENIGRSKLTAWNTLSTDLYFVWRGDTIDFSNMADSKVVELSDSTDVFATPTQVNNLILASAGGHNALTLGDSAQANGFSLNVQELEFDYSNYLTKNIYDYNGDSIVDNSKKLDGHSISKTNYSDDWDESDSIVTQDQMYNKISAMEGTIYEIRLPAANTVENRCTAATVGDDYPVGWTIEAGTSDIDLKVTHNLGRGIANISVNTLVGDVEAYLPGYTGYTGYNNVAGNVLTINSLSPKNLALTIYITFK